MFKQLLKHCEDNCLLPDFQSAYQANYSTETSLAWMANDILWPMEEQHITMMVILDLSVAFDMVDHNILFKIYENQLGVQIQYSNVSTATSGQDHSKHT